MPRSNTSLTSATTSLRSSLRIKGQQGQQQQHENSGIPTGLKRKASAMEVGKAVKGSKRAAFEDISNASEAERKSNIKSTMKKGLTSIRSNFAAKKSASAPPSKKALLPSSKFEKPAALNQIKKVGSDPSTLLEVAALSRTSSLEDAKSFEGIALSDVESESEEIEVKTVKVDSSPPEGVVDFDQENFNDPNQCSVYAASIFNYYKSRESQFAVSDYMKNGVHTEINESMRSILVDWLVEVQESFELNHETLYTSVKIFDLYLSLEKRPIKKDELQLIGATACLIACKVDERLPPPLDDFVYVCDDAYSREQIIVMERRIIQTVKFDVGYPLSYRFLRRYGRVCNVQMSVLTLARYILEMSLMEYEFNIIGMSESKLAASALILAFKIHGIQGWAPTLKYYSGYSPSKDLREIVMKLLKIIATPRRPNLKTIRDKYSHIVFHEVALVHVPADIVVDED